MGTPRVGFDIGGVLIRAIEDRSDTSFFSDNYLRTPPVEGAFDAVRDIVAEIGPQNAYIISKCGEKIEAKTRNWLSWQSFDVHTKFDWEHILYCRKRPDKAPLAKELELTHFVDDRLDVLVYMDSVDHRLLYGEAPQIRPHLPEGITLVESWNEIKAYILGG
ncbi:MAG TPA: hypothetical protein VJ742_12645 [Nitrososphaera sp.]|nr:hypothetical protein [Nitrososphaera sp.]